VCQSSAAARRRFGALYVDLPRNGVGVEMRSSVFGGELRKRCEARPFDLCAAD
jgi:hypothetical protein